MLPVIGILRRIGKVDLIGLADGYELTLVELKVAESTQNPRIALLELLAYWAVVRGNFARINSELENRAKGPGRLLIIAPLKYWDRWLEPKRKQRWLRFCYLLHEIQGKVDADIECLSLGDKELGTPRFTLERVEMG